MFKFFRVAKVLIIISLLLTLLIPYQAFADKNLEPVHILKFYDVEPLMMSRHQIILDNVTAFSNTNTGQDNIQTGTTDIQNLLITLAGINSADPAVNSLIQVVAGLLNSQLQIAIGQNSMAQQTSITDVGFKTEQANYTIVWNMEAMFISYNNLNQQIEEMNARKVLLEKQVKATKLQRTLGMITDAAVLNAEGQLAEIESGITQLKEARSAIKQTFNVNLAQKYDADILITEVPKVTKEMILTINVNNDFSEALKKSYSVILNDSDKDKENDAKRNFEKDFYRAYQAILEKQKVLDSESIKFNVAEKNITTAKLKYRLGILSTIQYQAEYSTYITRKIALAKAEDALFQAYRAYEWAKKGLIVSAASGK